MPLATEFSLDITGDRIDGEHLAGGGRDALVKCFAFPDGATAKQLVGVRVQECRLTAFDPLVITMTELSPSTTYIFRLLGVCRSDREKCIASVATFPAQNSDEETVNDGCKKLGAVERQLTIKFVNHSGQSDAGVFSNDWRKQIHVPVEVNVGPTVAVVYGLRIPRPRLVGILERIQDQRNQVSALCSAQSTLKSQLSYVFSFRTRRLLRSQYIIC